MRLALKSTLAFLAIYLVIVGAVAWWMAGQLAALSTGVAESTAQLVGSEIAHALTDSAIDELQRSDDATRARLNQIVDDVTQHSSILTSVAVVDRSGKVIAGDHVELGRQLASPDVIFDAARGARLVSVNGPFSGGSFYMLVPLKGGTDLAGYLRLEMQSARIAYLYADARRNLILIAVIGLVAVVGAGLLLHVEISRRSEALASELEGAVRGEPIAAAGRDEFSRALAVARKVGRELTEARGERQQLEQRMSVLVKALDVGVIVLEPTLELGFANGRAAELLGCRDAGALAGRWDRDIRPRLSDLPRQLAAAADRRADMDLAASAGAAHVTLEFYELGDTSREGFLVLVKSAESLEALQSELGLAIQMRGLTRFYAAFVHDLKAPLNAMVMTLELLRLGLQGGEADEAARAKQLKYVGVLNEEIHRFDRQLRTLLSHTAQSGDGPQALDLRTVVQELDALIAPQAKRQRVALTVQLPDEPVTLVGHADRLKQAMLNIIINALEAMPEGGELAITLEVREGAASLTLRDTGPGIPRALLDTIYDMHFSTKSSGTGVGLFVARSVMQAHGGTIEVRSAPGEGTTFILTLPLQAA
jgi:signal transduction histidine kinase